MLEKIADADKTAARIPFEKEYSEVDVMEIEVEYKRQNSHGPLNYYLSMG